MKQCKWCKKSKPLSDFTKNRREKDGHRRICRECSSAYERERYHDNPDSKQIRADYREDHVYRNRVYLYDFLKDHPCVDCGETDPIVLEFDHVRGKKESPISQLVAAGHSLSTIQKEIDKCEVRCANCHRRKTAIQLGWYDKIAPPKPKKSNTSSQKTA